MGAPVVVRMANELRTRNAITGNTRLIATHFSHGGKWLYQDLVKFFMPHGIEVSYDGMVITV
jgi:phosphoribosyl 1,2-cyclic phosphate phosphodiesterase